MQAGTDNLILRIKFNSFEIFIFAFFYIFDFLIKM